MKRESARKEMARERREQLRCKWSDKLWMFGVCSSRAARVVARTYIVTQSLSSIHLLSPPRMVRIAENAYLDWTLFDAAAAFFEGHSKAKYLVVTVVANSTGKVSSKRATITDWLE